MLDCIMDVLCRPDKTLKAMVITAQRASYGGYALSWRPRQAVHAVTWKPASLFDYNAENSGTQVQCVVTDC